MNVFTRFAAAALVGIGFGAAATTGATAQDLGPRLVGSGENLSVEYPAPSANVVGGAIYVHADGSGQGASLQAIEAQETQSGRIATVTGTGENLSVTYQEAASAAKMLARGGLGA